MVVVYSESVTRRYFAPRVSAAYCLILVVAITSIFLPFFIAYSASGPSFWSKNKSYLEQPDINYEYKFIQILEGTKDYGTAPLTIFFSSMSHLNTALGNGGKLRFPLVRSKEIDEEGDGKFDRLEFSSEMPLSDGEQILSSKLFVFFKLKLDKWSRVSLSTMGYSQQTSPLASNSLFIDADLNWKQTWPLPARRGYHTPYTELVDDTLLLPWTDGNQTLQNFFPRLISSFRSRNYTTDLDDRYSLWGGVGSNTVSYLSGQSMKFNLTTTIRYPISEIMYTPGVSEVILDGWIRYLAIFVITSWLLYYCFCNFIFSNHLLDTYEHVDNEPMNTFSRFKRHLS